MIPMDSHSVEESTDLLHKIETLEILSYQSQIKNLTMQLPVFFRIRNRSDKERNNA
jgi:hypothetical protein